MLCLWKLEKKIITEHLYHIKCHLKMKESIKCPLCDCCYNNLHSFNSHFQRKHSKKQNKKNILNNSNDCNQNWEVSELDVSNHSSNTAEFHEDEEKLVENNNESEINF